MLPRPRAERLLALALLAGTPLALLAQQTITTPLTAVPPRPTPVPPDEPLRVQAERITGRPDLEMQAEGQVELERGPLRVRAERARFRQDTQLLQAGGGVRMEQDGNRFAGSELELKVDTREGFLLDADYFLAPTQAGGHAQRVELLGPQRARVVEGTYTSCTPEGGGTPAWLLSADRVDLDLANNEGVARGGVLRFYGVPILGAPALSFPLTGERKSGWLPPAINIDSRSGLALAVPYYWNLAPNRDLTLTPSVLTRRGAGLDTEFRYLEPDYKGRLNLDLLPWDQQAHRSRWALGVDHDGRWDDVRYRAVAVRVSDNDYWSDFRRSGYLLNAPDTGTPLTRRLLPLDLQAQRRIGSFGLPGGEWTAYARTLQWQVLQSSTDPAGRIEPPYERVPQLGVQGGAPLAAGLRLDAQTEFNRFELAPSATPGLVTGNRWHATGTLSRPFTAAWGWITPRLSLNLASYATDTPMADGRTSASRSIPSFSTDAGLLFERDSSLFGRALRQTLEPRLLYVRTPYREQGALPLFDTAGKDFNITSIYTENAFSGVDRISDANQVTAGVTSRFLDAGNGQELARVGVAQRVLFSEQRLTPEGVANTQRLSDLLLLGSSVLSERWSADGTVQYNHQTQRVSRSVVGARYSPGPFRTLSARYRYSRDLSEQVEVGWQWPLYGPTPSAAPAGAGSCGGSLYSVGRMSYSLRDARVVDSIFGFEYDAGCWIARVVTERLSTGRSEAVTRLLFQLEFVGLSRLGTDPLQVLRGNVPGYRPLREEPRVVPPPVSYE